MGTVSVGSLDQLNNLKLLQNAKSQKIDGQASLAVRFLWHEIERGLTKQNGLAKETNRYLFLYVYNVHLAGWVSSENKMLLSLMSRE